MFATYHILSFAQEWGNLQTRKGVGSPKHPNKQLLGSLTELFHLPTPCPTQIYSDQAKKDSNKSSLHSSSKKASIWLLIQNDSEKYRKKIYKPVIELKKKSPINFSHSLSSVWIRKQEAAHQPMSVPLKEY